MAIPAPIAPEVIADGRPRQLDLFAPSAIREGSNDDPGHSLSGGGKEGAALAEARINAWTQDFHAKERALQAGVPLAMKELGQRMHDWFMPGDEALERSTRFGLGAGATLERYARQAAGANDVMIGDATEPIVLSGDRRLSKSAGDFASKFSLCFGACGDASHQVAGLVATVQIDHDDQGLPTVWKVFESSGDQQFDTAALGSIRDAVDHIDVKVLATPPRPAWSRWQMAQIAYRWGQIERLMDPGWTPPGTTRSNDLLGKTTIVREVRLVAITYRSLPSPRRAERP